MGKKQAWFFRNSEQALRELQEEMRSKLEQHQWQLLYIVSSETGIIQWWVQRCEDGEIVWSSLQLRTIVDFDITLEDFREWMNDPKPQAQKKSPADEVEEPDIKDEMGIIGRFFKNLLGGIEATKQNNGPVM